MKSNRIIQLYVYNALIRFISIRKKAESHNVFPFFLSLLLNETWASYWFYILAEFNIL